MSNRIGQFVGHLMTFKSEDETSDTVIDSEEIRIERTGSTVTRVLVKGVEVWPRSHITAEDWGEIQSKAKSCQRTWGIGFPVISVELLRRIIDGLERTTN